MGIGKKGGGGLLIVPYGIEIGSSPAPPLQELRLLIVPYGIEIQSGTGLHRGRQAFNRTLWN